MQKSKSALVILAIMVLFVSVMHLLVTSGIVDDYLDYPVGSLRALTHHFIGELLEIAIAVPYESSVDHYRGHEYGLLKFKAEPTEMIEFVNRFCEGFGYKGYDPFNAIDIREALGRVNLIYCLSIRMQ